MAHLKYFKGSLAIGVLGILIGLAVGWHDGGTLSAGLAAAFLTLVLAVLEVSLSFDNAVINASILKEMPPIWQKRFLTWGILFAVFGTRLVLPLVIVSVIAHLNPWAALLLAATQPHRYAQIMISSHLMLAGFGGSFLLMVSLKYFFDQNKDVHWIETIEKPLKSLGKMESVEIIICFLLIYILSLFLPGEDKQYQFTLSGVGGVVAFLVVDGISQVLKLSNRAQGHFHKAGLAMFVYLEVLDSTFSFDGVIGAFALTENIFIIAAGLGIGAMFVRSLTVLFVERETLDNFKYLEHGAFYAIGTLALIMIFGIFIEVPEVVTGLIGAVFIGLSLISSLKAGPRNI